MLFVYIFATAGLQNEVVVVLSCGLGPDELLWQFGSLSQNAIAARQSIRLLISAHALLVTSWEVM